MTKDNLSIEQKLSIVTVLLSTLGGLIITIQWEPKTNIRFLRIIFILLLTLIFCWCIFVLFWKNRANGRLIPRIKFDSAKLRFGLSLGWQLARYEIIYKPQDQQFLPILEGIKTEINMMLLDKGFNQSIDGKASELMHNILQFFSFKDDEIYNSILLGIAGFRQSLVGSSSKEENNDEMQKIATSAINDVSISYIGIKSNFISKLKELKPQTITDLIDLINNHSG